MVTATAKNIRALLRRESTVNEATWNAVCLADFGNGGVAFVAEPQIPPRNANWPSKGRWVHFAKIAFEKYFLGKMRRGESEPFYERYILDRLGIRKLKKSTRKKANNGLKARRSAKSSPTYRKQMARRSH